MSFAWREYIKLAEELIIQNKKESCLRSGISRAYYGVFCIMRDKAGLKSYRERDVHGKVINHYKSSNDGKERYVGKLLDELRKKRNDADYDEDKNINADSAKTSLLESKTILQKMDISL